jgi:hypothetical protein
MNGYLYYSVKFVLLHHGRPCHPLQVNFSIGLKAIVRIKASYLIVVAATRIYLVYKEV